MVVMDPGSTEMRLWRKTKQKTRKNIQSIFCNTRPGKAVSEIEHSLNIYHPSKFYGPKKEKGHPLHGQPFKK
jgi:hypothetical protein